MKFQGLRTGHGTVPSTNMVILVSLAFRENMAIRILIRDLKPLTSIAQRICRAWIINTASITTRRKQSLELLIPRRACSQPKQVVGYRSMLVVPSQHESPLDRKLEIGNPAWRARLSRIEICDQTDTISWIRNNSKGDTLCSPTS